MGFRLGRVVSQIYGSGFCLNDFLGNVCAVHFFGPSVQPSFRQFPSANSEEGAGFSLRSGFVSAVQKDWSESTLNESEHACRIIVGAGARRRAGMGLVWSWQRRACERQRYTVGTRVGR